MSDTNESSGRSGDREGSNQRHGSDVPIHEQWDFPPAHPPLSDERPDSFPTEYGDEEAYQAYYESRCGSRHKSMPVEVYSGEFEVSERFVDAHEGAVGQLQWNENLADLDIVHESPDRYAGERWCTGTLIDDDLLLTAGHCFTLHNMPRPAEVARHMHVNFNYQVDSAGNLRDEEEYDIVKLVEHEFQLEGLDYAIVRLDGDPGATHGTIELATADPDPDDVLCIISHPDGLPKRVEAGHTTHLHDVRIGYGDIDTAYGSSGAGILASPSGKLVGVHTMGGCDTTRSGHNHGIRISSLLSASPTLNCLTAQSTPDAGQQPGVKSATSGKNQPLQQTGGHRNQSSEHTQSDEPASRPAGRHPTSEEPPGQSSGRHPSSGEPCNQTSGTAPKESHRSTVESHRSTLESHRSTLQSHRSTVEAHQSTLDVHRSTLDAHRTMLKLHAETLESSIAQLKAFRDALSECTTEMRALTGEQQTQGDHSHSKTHGDDEHHTK